MKQQLNRKAIVLSGFITAFILTLGVGGYLLWQGWGTTTAAAGTDTLTSPVLQMQQAQPTADDASVAVYQAQIEEAYRALEEAYVQIETLQAAQAQPQGQGRVYDHDDDEHEHEDEHERRGEFEHEHDDD